MHTLKDLALKDLAAIEAALEVVFKAVAHMEDVATVVEDLETVASTEDSSRMLRTNGGLGTLATPFRTVIKISKTAIASNVEEVDAPNLQDGCLLQVVRQAMDLLVAIPMEEMETMEEMEMLNETIPINLITTKI